MVAFIRLRSQRDRIAISDRILEVHAHHTVFIQRIDRKIEFLPRKLSRQCRVSHIHHKRELKRPARKEMAHLLRRISDKVLHHGIPVGDWNAAQGIPLIHHIEHILVRLVDRGEEGITGDAESTGVQRHTIRP